VRAGEDLKLFDRWTREEELHLVSRRWDGARTKVIARELKRERAAVDAKIQRLKARGL
jgi:predicted transcriptional regulator